MQPISRRDFLKLGGVALASLAFTSFLPEFTEFDDIDLVRVAKDPVSVYKEPDDKSLIVRTWQRDDLVHVYETVNSGTPAFNPIWYRVFGGYMHRARLQKVRIHYNPPLTNVPDTKLLAELTVPYAQPYRYNQWDGWLPITYRLYYTSTQWITGIETGPDGKAWYIVQDDADTTFSYYVPAMQLRPISPEEITPLSPEVAPDKKHIEVNLRTQTLTCYENNQIVLTADVSTGLPGLFDTPAGRKYIEVKLASRRMSTTNLFSDDIALAGVPWCSFFTNVGHAFHGTYWHDNFGLPMSHGCVNMRTEDAKWLFRWSQPTAGFEEIDKYTLDTRGYGTVVDIHH
ncbi:MAG TPA: L,D-transpeptidase family protein [Anaerolineales bacterium]